MVSGQNAAPSADWWRRDEHDQRAAPPPFLEPVGGTVDLHQLAQRRPWAGSGEPAPPGASSTAIAPLPPSTCATSPPIPHTRAPPSTSPTPGSVQSPRRSRTTPTISRLNSGAIPLLARLPRRLDLSPLAPSSRYRRTSRFTCRTQIPSRMPPPAPIASPTPPVSHPLGPPLSCSAPLRSLTFPCPPLPLFLRGHLSFAQKGTLSLCANSAFPSLVTPSPL